MFVASLVVCAMGFTSPRQKTLTLVLFIVPFEVSSSPLSFVLNFPMIRQQTFAVADRLGPRMSSFACIVCLVGKKAASITMLLTTMESLENAFPSQATSSSLSIVFQ